MAASATDTVCLICDQQHCPYFRSHVDLKVGKHDGKREELKFAESSLDEYNEFFFGPCQRCDQPAARGTPERSLCPNCQHLRLQHFFLCTAEDGGKFPGLKLPLGTYRQIQAGRDAACEFCTLVDKSLQIQRVAASYLFNAREDVKDDWEAFIKRDRYHPARSMEINWTQGIGTFDLRLLRPITLSDTEALNLSQSSQDRGIAVPTPHISWTTVKEWLLECDSQHPHAPVDIPQISEDLPEGFMVIDVGAGCIVDAPRNCCYIALSYVWGELRPGELTAITATLASLRVPESLRKSTLPPTIWDAMTVCQKLGAQYLWVDRLCIIQDSDTQKSEHIRAMDAIYARSWLTICAVGSPDSHTGLWGCDDTPRSLTQGCGKIGDMWLAYELPDDRYWRLGHLWWKRAWTYQEYVLSRRKLLISPWQVTFECDHTVRSDACVGRRFNVIAETEIRKSERSRLQVYADVVEEYNDRMLTWQDDIYDAFQGVFKSIYKSLDQFVWGLPASDFDQALSWFTESLDRWPNEVLGPMGSGIPRFPRRPGGHIASWSWASSSGRTSLDNGWNVISSMARYNTWDEKAGLRPVITDGVVWKSDEFNPRLYAWCAWDLGFIDAPLPSTLRGRSFHILADKLQERWPTYKEYWREAFLATGNAWVCEESAKSDLLKEKNGRLLLRSSLINTCIGKPWSGEFGEGYARPILAPDGTAIGFIDNMSTLPTATLSCEKKWDFVALSIGSGEWIAKKAMRYKPSQGYACDFKPLPEQEK